MITALALSNLLALSLQMVIVVAAAALLAYAFRMRSPSAKLAYWQLVLLICLALPFTQTWQRPLAPVPQRPHAQATTTQYVPQVPTPAPSPITFRDAMLYFLIAGTLARVIWLGVGFYSLRRYRRRSRPLYPLPSAIAAAARRLGIDATFAVSKCVPGPITFGIRRPLILLPEGVVEMGEASQEAIAYHELIHVRRLDWAWTAAEECVLSVLWFHPAVWWLVGQIRLAREQVVDREAVALTESRNLYVEALLAVAGFHPITLPTPATLFLQRRHLLKRVTAVFKENRMSKQRLISCFTTGLGAAFLAARVAVTLFPLHAMAQAPSAPIQIETGADNLVFRPAIEYPGVLVRQHIEGVITVELNVDAQGTVADARILSGPDALRRFVLRSVLQWRYDPAKHAAGTNVVTVRFTLPQNNESFVLAAVGGERNEQLAIAKKMLEQELGKMQSDRAPLTPAEKQLAMKRMDELKARVAMVASSGPTGQISSIQPDGLAPADVALFAGKLPVKVGDSINPESYHKLQAELRAIDERLRVFGVQDDAGKVGLRIGMSHEPSQQELALDKAKAEGLARISVSGQVNSITTDGMTDAEATRVMSNLPVRIGDTIDAESFSKLQAQLRGIDERLGVNWQRDENGKVTLHIRLRD